MIHKLIDQNVITAVVIYAIIWSIPLTLFQDQTPTVQKLSSAKALCKDKDVTDDFDFSDLSMEQTKVEEEKPKQFVFMLTGNSSI